MVVDSRLPTVFVSIASYRDPDCQHTVRDLFAKASHPERIFIGICWQFVPGEDDDCFKLEERPAQVRTIKVYAQESRGACWARSRAQELWQGEDYYFQIDSHMRFVAGWDELLIGMLAECPGPKPVLSTYPLAFTPPDQLAADALATIRPLGFDEAGVLTQRSTLSVLSEAPAQPTPTAFIGAGLLFAAGQIVEEVPYDPRIYFEGEEITLAVRLWTAGWDLYAPNKVVAYHDYGLRPERPRHWKDRSDWGALNDQARKRIRHLLGIEAVTDPEALQELRGYGLGTARSLAEYEAFAQLDFKAHLYRQHPLPNPKIAADQAQQLAQRQAVFTGIWKNNFWNSPETRSGGGSTLAATTALRAWLPATLAFLQVRSLADAGCGEVNWMQGLTAGLRFYFGFDIVPELVADLRQRFAQRANCFFTAADIVTHSLPACDAILCRDCLTHLPIEAVAMAIHQFRQSGAHYLIATTHSVGRNIWVRNGGWHTLDLTAAPFKLPPPRLLLQEGGSKQLGVWAMQDIPEQG